MLLDVATDRLNRHANGRGNLVRGNPLLVQLNNAFDNGSLRVRLRLRGERRRASFLEDWLQVFLDVTDCLEHLAKWTVGVHIR